MVYGGYGIGKTTFSLYLAKESRSRESAQDDKWSFCLTAGTL
jgi:predicted NACHT family NTPase